MTDASKTNNTDNSINLPTMSNPIDLSAPLALSDKNEPIRHYRTCISHKNTHVETAVNFELNNAVAKQTIVDNNKTMIINVIVHVMYQSLASMGMRNIIFVYILHHNSNLFRGLNVI